jgi:hypothetical protein
VGADVYYEDYSDADKDVCYVFRIRTRLDEKGNLIKAYYGKMFDELKDVKDNSYDLQINYQKFYDLCTDEEKKKLDEMIKERG